MNSSFSETVMIIVFFVIITFAGFRIAGTMIGPSMSNQMGLSSVHAAQVRDSNPLDALSQVLGGH